MVDTYRALLSRVLAEPANDTPRLILADWLGEHGDPAREEFIRVQCELAKLEASIAMAARSVGDGPPPQWHDQQEELRRRERELMGNGVCLYCSWHAPISHALYQWTFRRGFVSAITLSADDALTHLDAILAQQPVEEVTLLAQPTDVQYVRLLKRWTRLPQTASFQHRRLIEMLHDIWPKVRDWRLPWTEGQEQP